MPSTHEEWLSYVQEVAPDLMMCGRGPVPFPTYENLLALMLEELSPEKSREHFTMLFKGRFQEPQVTQVELAEKIGVSKQRIRVYESFMLSLILRRVIKDTNPTPKLMQEWLGRCAFPGSTARAAVEMSQHMCVSDEKQHQRDKERAEEKAEQERYRREERERVEARRAELARRAQEEEQLRLAHIENKRKMREEAAIAIKIHKKAAIRALWKFSSRLEEAETLPNGSLVDVLHHFLSAEEIVSVNAYKNGDYPSYLERLYDAAVDSGWFSRVGPYEVRRLPVKIKQ